MGKSLTLYFYIVNPILIKEKNITPLFRDHFVLIPGIIMPLPKLATPSRIGCLIMPLVLFATGKKLKSLGIQNYTNNPGGN